MAGPHNLHAHYNGDDDNNASNNKTIIAVLDIVAPILALPLSFTVPATSPAGAFVIYSATATDNLDPSVSVICAPSSGFTFPVGATTVNCTATDAAGNTTSGSFTVTVSPFTVPVTVTVDSTPPTIGFSLAGTPGQNGWYISSVLVDFLCTDAGSGIASCGPDVTLAGQGGNFATGIANDVAGNSASLVVNVKIDTMKPTITASAGGYTGAWTNQDVTVSFTCNDATSGIGDTACPAADTYAAEGQYSSTPRTVSDNAGNLSDASNTVAIKIDKTAPTVTAAATTAANGNGWYKADVTIGYTCADEGGSGLTVGSVTACAGSQTLTATGSSSALTVSDIADNSTTSNTVAVQIDKTAPTVTAAATTAANGNGWYKADVTIGYTCADEGGSGLTVGSVTACLGTETLTTTGSSTALTVSDNADNSTTSNTVAVQIDKIAPTVTYNGATTYDVDQTIAITCTPSDAGGSGLASSTCTNTTGPAYNFGPGSTTLSATAIDNAGNTGSGSTTFTVRVTATGLCNLTKTFASKPLGSSLCAQLNAAAAAKLRGNTQAAGNATAAYVREVQAQTGKAFTTWQADILIRLVRGL